MSQIGTSPRNRALLAGIALLLAGVSIAGPLTPPPGTVAPTYKTLTEVEPRIAINSTNTPGDADSLFKITQPGSYYLSGNITGTAFKNGIKITASGVTLDLKGFALTGVASAFAGVSCSNTASRVVILNGSISGWPLDGIDGGYNNNGRYESLQTSGNGAGTGGRFGIRIGGSAIINNCTSSGNTGGGFGGNDACTFTGCTAVGNTDTGFSFGSGCSLRACTAQSNTVKGFSGGASNVVVECTATGASAATISRGIALTNNCTIRDCTASGYYMGIQTLTGCIFSNCSAASNTGFGISVTSGCKLTNCSASANAATGIQAATACTLTSCISYANNRGIEVSSSSTISGCSVHDNFSAGIVCSGECVIRDNSCTGPASATGIGIYVLGTLNRIEHNTCVHSDIGIAVDGTRNIIAGNTCGNNSFNWDINPGNSVGPVIVAGTNAATIAGNGPSASALGSSDPNANFSY